jgi:hypothetical protein
MGNDTTTEHKYSAEKRCLTVYSNETERLGAEYEFKGFDLTAFRDHFGNCGYDPLMYNEYPVGREDIEFLAKYLSRRVDFDFDRYSYFVSCYKED